MTQTRRHRIIYVTVDLLTTALAMLLYNVLRFYVDPSVGATTLSGFLLYHTVMTEQVLFPLLMLGLYWLSGYYNNVFLKSRSEELALTALSTLLGTGIFFALALINNALPRRMMIYLLTGYLWGMLLALVYTGRALVTAYVRREVFDGKWMLNTMVVGSGAATEAMARRLADESRWSGMRILGCLDPGADLVGEVGGRGLDCLVVMPQAGGHDGVLDVICRVLPLGVDVLTPPDLYRMLTSQMRVDKIAGEPLVNIGRSRASESTLNLKRLCDVVAGVAGLVAAAPVMLAFAVAIRRESPGPAIFAQERVGRNNKPFTIYKLRSMRSHAEHDGPELCQPDDARVTRVGRFMRKYRIDELPQFWNVVRGDMSLVGPRPERAYFVEQILERAPYYSLLQQVRPGITSLGMVKFGYASSVDDMVERLRYDLMYLENISLTTDLKILVYTVKTVVTGKGI